MEVTLECVKAWCAAHREEQISLLKYLAAIPAPSFREERRAEFIRRWLQSNGGQGAALDGANNVVLPIPGREEGPYTVYAAHTDVVFPDTAPLPIREEGHKIIGPGVGDDTANVVALMLCAKFLLEEGITPPTPILIVFDTCEEGLGNLAGVRRLMEDYAGRVKEFVSFDLTWDKLVTRAVGSERWQIRAETAGGHSYNAFGSPNAIAHLAEFIGKLYSQPLPTVRDQKTTYNVGTIQGGTTINTIAPWAEMTYEYRSDHPACLEQMSRQFHTMLAQTSTPEVKVTATLLGKRPCGGAKDREGQEELLRRCRRAVLAAAKVPPMDASLSTDANLPLSLGIPATTVGLYLGHGEHTREEWVLRESLVTGLEIGLRIILDI